MKQNLPVLLLLVFCVYTAAAQRTVLIHSDNQMVEVSNYFQVWNDPGGRALLQEVRTKNRSAFHSYTSADSTANTDVQWLYFRIENTDSVAHTMYLSLPFIDHIECYTGSDSSFRHAYSGDLLALSRRETKTGQVCIIASVLPSKTLQDCYIRLESSTTVSRQFRPVSLRSVNLYTEKSFTERFETSRIYQALFYGAIVIMLLYNLFIFFSIRSRSYLIYVLFLFSLILFLASNNGYIFELIIPDYPRLDLYIRFLSTPLMLCCFLFFTREYLEAFTHTPVLDKGIRLLILVFLLIAVFICFGHWYKGRLLIIIAALTSFVFVLIVSVTVLKKGYKPATYFLIANMLLILGAIFYSLERFHVVAHNPLTQYSIQLSVVFQSIFFSIGLADRINLVQKRLSLLKLENESLERSRQVEKQKMTEEQNTKLEKSNLELDTFIYKTAHDIRGPLARLMGLCNVGLQDVSDEKGKTYLQMMKTDADYLNYILNRLSTAHEIKNIHPEPEQIHLNNLVAKILSEISFHEEYKRVHITVHMAENSTIATDVSLLKFILLNLVDNAMTFRNKDPEIPSEITIRAFNNPGSLQIEVMDNGIGIPEDEIPFLFEMFSKAAGKYHTPGLGLYMSALCAEKLHGTIRLTQSANPTVFLVTIPL